MHIIPVQCTHICWIYAYPLYKVEEKPPIIMNQAISTVALVLDGITVAQVFFNITAVDPNKRLKQFKLPIKKIFEIHFIAFKIIKS